MTERWPNFNQTKISAVLDITYLSVLVSAVTSTFDKKKNVTEHQWQHPLYVFRSAATNTSLTPISRHTYDNVGLKREHHVYENVGELRDATPDLILAVKPKVPMEEEQVRG